MKKWGRKTGKKGVQSEGPRIWENRENGAKNVHTQKFFIEKRKSEIFFENFYIRPAILRGFCAKKPYKTGILAPIRKKRENGAKSA